MGRTSAAVGSRELKTRLGHYLGRVRRGETLVVTDRNEPVAELRPLAQGDDPAEARLQAMSLLGLVSRGAGGRLAPFEPIASKASATDLIRQDRDERG
jgi:prevent-host-death family protein